MIVIAKPIKLKLSCNAWHQKQPFNVPQKTINNTFSLLFLKKNGESKVVHYGFVSSPEGQSCLCIDKWIASFCFSKKRFSLYRDADFKNVIFDDDIITTY